jgi:hypothetical protein
MADPMSEKLYERCPICNASRVASISYPCRTCDGEGYIETGLTSGQVEALKARAGEFRAMQWGYSDRRRGVALDAMPCRGAMSDGQVRWWEKGWQWRDDQMARVAAEDRLIAAGADVERKEDGRG